MSERGGIVYKKTLTDGKWLGQSCAEDCHNHYGSGPVLTCWESRTLTFVQSCFLGK